MMKDCAQALRSWPESGVPSHPEAWLLTVARNRRTDLRRSAVHRLADPLDDVAHDGVLSVVQEHDPDSIPDRRLALLFVCAHPAIDPAVRAPLMLQAVLGFDADQIARAFTMPTAAMAIDFPLVAGPEPRGSLATESHYLATALAELLPDEPEALGLAALISLSIARRPTPGTVDAFVPLDQQDPSLWNAELIALGERQLHHARALGRTGRFQIEAAIQSVHCARATSGLTDWHALRTLHAALLSMAPTLGARVAHAAAVGRVEGALAGIAALDAITDDTVQRFQPAWATRAHLLAAAGRAIEAAEAYERAISLTTDNRLRPYLARQHERVLDERRD